MEYLDVVDEKGQPTGEVVSREKAHLEGIRHRTAHVWILRDRGEGTEVLLQKRTMNKDSFPGCYDISSAGHIPAGMGFTESALRELKEELGITAAADELRYVGDLSISNSSVFHDKPFVDDQFSRVFCLVRDLEASDLILQPEEVESVRWLDLVTLKAYVHASFEHRPFEEDAYSWSCIIPDELDMLPAHLFMA